ncbi:MAG: hypothetical protein H6986_07465 [Pseudomonadales bacterium]|nr:hypothetical protein [Pseudomonadales bacterium]
MNGRIYEPGLGRMLSPDPVTQAPENGQNYNRYTYAYNNPLKYADPSGFEASEPELVLGPDIGSSIIASVVNGIFGPGLKDIFGSIGNIFGGSNCDLNCKFRKEAWNWCVSDAACNEARQQGHGRGQQWSIAKRLFAESLHATVGDSTTDSGTPTTLITLVEFTQTRNEKTKDIGQPTYELNQVIFTDLGGPLGVALWKKSQKVERTWEQRDGRLVYNTETGRVSVVWDKWESKRTTETVTSPWPTRTRAVRASYGKDIENGDVWTTSHPGNGWTCGGYIDKAGAFCIPP